MRNGFLVCMMVATTVCGRAVAQEYVFETPTDDRWHYPFSGTPGNRGVGTIFGAVFDTFNDRDAIVLVAWDTTGLIAPGQGAENYNIDSITVTLTNQANQFSMPDWLVDTTVDEWFTYDLNLDEMVNADGIPRGEPGDTDGESDDVDPGRPLELFGMGFAGFGPFDEFSWVESSIYIGSSGAGNVPRDPFPFVFDQDLNRLHVEDSVKGLHNEDLGVFGFTPEPWAVGVPIGYTPGIQASPFDVEFEINLALSGGEVKRYFQEQLNNGRIMVAITSLNETAIQGPQSGIPAFYMSEGTMIDPGAKAPLLSISLSNCNNNGDIDGDLDVDLIDVESFASVAVGNETTPTLVAASDLNCDGSVDGLDVSLMVQNYLE